jgi:exopolysaccharide biosynthesis operon protein EpsL
MRSSFNNPKPILVRHFSLLRLLSISILFVSLNVLADEKDPLNAIVGISRKYDDNLFLLPASVRSDRITTEYVGVRLDKQYAMQRLKFDYTLTKYQYQTYNYLNFDAKEYKAAWLWTLTPYLTGSLSADRSQSQYGFQDVKNNGTKNVSTRDNRNFSADWSPYGNWHMLAGLTNSRNLNSQNFQADRGYQQNSIDFGLRYAFRSGSSITLMEHDRQGVYENSALDSVHFYDNGFSEKENEAQLAWQLSGKSALNLRAAMVNREHDHFSQRDYSGLNGNVSYTWTPTGRLQLSLSAARDLASYQTINSNYTRNDTLSIAPSYVLSEKVTVRGSASITDRTFVGEGVIPSSNRVDTSKIASINIDWTPMRSVTIGANLQRNSRSSNVSGFDFSDTTAGLSANLYF